MQHSKEFSEAKEANAKIEREENACRGYYSEVITEYYDDEDEEPIIGGFKKTNFLWQIRTEKHSPTLRTLKEVRKNLQLQDAERWMTYDEDDFIEFSVDTFKPKVQLPLNVYPYEMTRSVATERLMRAYQGKNIKVLLNEMNISPADMVSVPLLKLNYPEKVPKTSIIRMQNYLPLELFDDEEFDCRTPENWIELGMLKGVQNPLPGEAFVPVEPNELAPFTEPDDVFMHMCNWINVAVVDYNADTKLWHLITLDGTRRTFQLPRIYVMFKAEDPSVFARRILAAVSRRAKVASTLRYQFYLNTMLLVGIPCLNDTILDIIYKSATRGGLIKDESKWEKLVKQVQNIYQQTQCDLQFRLDAGKDPRLNEYLGDAMKNWETSLKQPVRTKTGMKSFAGMRDYFKWMHLYVIPESFRALFLVVGECLKVEKMSLYTRSYGIKRITLDEFELVQTQCTNNVVKYLQGQWLETIVYNIRMCLRDVGKGWFDINVNKHFIYTVSKLQRFMELVKFRMQFTLRVLVINSIEMFIDMVETPCLPCLVVKDDFVWGSNLIESPFIPKASAIFILQMKMDEKSAFYSTKLELFEKVLLKLYDTALTHTHKIKQIHPFLLENLKFPKDLMLSSVGLLSEEVAGVRNRFVLAYKKALIPLVAYAKEFDIFIELFTLDIKAYVEKFKEEQHTASEVKEEVSFHYRMKANLEATLPVSIVIGPFYITIEQLRHFLINKRQDLAMKLLDMFCQRMKHNIVVVLEEYEKIFEKLNQKPDSIETIFDIRDWMETIPMSVRAQEESVRRYMIEYDVLDHFWYSLPQEDFDNKWLAIGWPHKLAKQVDLTEQYLKEEEERFYKIQLSDEYTLNDKIETFTAQVVQMAKMKDFSKVHEIAVDIRRLWKAMKDAQEQGQLLNQRQKLFGVAVIPFDNLLKLIKEFEPYKTLWTTAADWLRNHEMWMENPIVNVDIEAVERLATEMYKTIVKSVRVFSEIEAVQEIALEVKSQIEEFRPLIPILVSLRNPGMRPRHWEDFSKATGVEIVWTAGVTFQDCLNIGIAKYSTELSSIADHASKEFGIEQTLNKMLTEWENCTMELNPYKDTGTYIMKIPEETQQMLDDHIVLTQQLSFSPFKGPFEQQIDQWEESLKTTTDVIEEWMDVQKQWMYLEPILTSEDIRIQLPAESKKYGSMERTWRRIMRGARENPYIIKYCADRKLFESLKDANHILDIVQKGLTDYLETKRTAFPRLYFLSDDELLEILSHAKNPLAVQPHLRKCFENIARLNFEQDLKITQMFSGEDECVDLNPTLYPTANVENWLLLVETSMKSTIRSILEESLKAIFKTARDKWVLEWPGQVVIACSQAFWTAGVEDGIRNNALKAFLEEVVFTNLDALRGLVKGALSFLHREILSALIVIEVHARDVTQNIVDLNISNVNDFDWISQLRYYWVEVDMKVRAVNAEFQYGYEYLGNSGRLVITPLTDRCYLTLTGALHLKFGGAPAGPAGTGKTETTKDLAKAMALQCVVFNCSDQLDFMAMGKFFKGLASSGAWACFDEFNRIDIEVLSVVAQQITTIQKAQQARLEVFVFEGAEIRLKESCAVFITMNPGYAGRTELPDNLKALFRPVSMMVPDYSLISEISLFSFGFGNAKLLANKITTTFKLSSEQLSTQDHYDFGMRAVKTVIAVAGNLKREKPVMDESQIVLRALRDVNVPKFLKDDLKLFNGIVSDLFPKMVEEPVDYGALEKSIRACCVKMGLEDVNEFVRKVIQLYETTIVRHGLMLVGPTASGKTKCYEVLKAAMTSLDGQPQPSGQPFRRAHAYVMNPKSITMGQLYGEFDLQTHEWTDGILPCLVRIGVAAENKDKRWYVFDGPVDAVWIENMNTVLDDNKKLCLSSGEIIKLRDTMTMMFEVADLAVASPATVSRCGMVYLEPGVLGLDPFVNCWLKRLPPLMKTYTENLRQLIYTYIIPAIDLLRNHLREILTSVDSALLVKFLRLMDFWLIPLTGRDNKPPPSSQYLALIPYLLVPWIVFSLIWSVGATCDNQSRLNLDRWIRKKMDREGDTPAFPSKGLVYDYRLHDGGFTDVTDDGQPHAPYWYSWLDNVEEYQITVDMKYTDIEVPTMDTIRNSKMLETVLSNYDNVLCVGPTGTGKSLTVVGKLSRSMHKKFICDFMSFSARTSANQTQDLIDAKLDRRRKGVFGPPVLKRQIFFIDDFNMPALEVYGAQPPIELIRQWMDFGGWYDRKNIGDFRTIIDTNFCVAMGPPGGGRNPVTARLLRHFHYLAFIEMEDDSKRKIFGSILKFWMDRIPGDFELGDFYLPILEATLHVYTVILKELLPTPAKTHYTFNLRDLSKVFQGMLMYSPEKITGVELLIRLWYHECCRVFQDRLVNDDDRNWFSNLLRKKIKTDYKVMPTAALGTQMLFFADFIDPTTDYREYQQITDMEKLAQVLDHYLDEYNNQSTRPMKLVLFLDAISHVCRISRIIRQPLGNALLLGVGGSGRQSLTRLATFMAEYACFQIEIHKAYGMVEWRDDIKNLMLRVGLQKRESVFLFSDTQIKSEAFLEDLNNILNSGDVPNIYPQEELDKIYQEMKGLVQEMGLVATKSNLFATYQKVVRANLHSVITMSPIGDVFRARLRQFPALVNCCTIDWFSEWPDSALQSVALQFLVDISVLNVSQETVEGIVMVCQFMHASVVDASVLYKQELSRHNYVTPTSYLELLSSYIDLMTKKKGALSEGISRLSTGLGKLQSTAEEVKVLQERLKEMKPALETAKQDAETMITEIAKDQEVAEETKQIVEKEELEAAKKTLATQTIAEDAQRDLDEALPDLLAAEASLKSLNKNDIIEVRSMKRPPSGVVYVVESICIVKGIKPNKLPGAMPGVKVLDYWDPGRNMLADPGQFLASLMNFDKESITEEMIEKLRSYVTNPLFQPAKVAKVSKACKSLCMWVHAMFKYYFVNKRVAPKKAALAEAKAELALTEAALAAATAKMESVMNNLRLLEKKLAAKIAFKEEKEANIQVCLERMSRAVRLITGLSDERIRWLNTIASIEGSIVNVTGDILLSAGAVAYLTPFTDKYRRGLLSEWLKAIQEQKIPCSPDPNPVSILAEPVQIRAWQLDGLPRDYFSTENAVLVSNSKRWPLFIDPQGQANKWVKNMEKSNGISICKMADKELARTLESAVRFGKPVLIEGIGIDLDPGLDPLLLRQKFKQAGTWMLKLGDVVVPYDEDFRLYMTTKLPNPHYTPEICVKVLLVNFTLVPSGLQDQLLALVVMQERPDLEDQRSQLIVANTQMRQELKEIEDRILYKLSSMEGSPLDDLDFIITLEASKIKSDDIKAKVTAAEITQIDIDNTRAQYIPVANRAQILFFCLSDLSNVDPMYQYSLEWFIGIFISSMAETERTDNISERVVVINEYFTFSLYSNVCRSLFEKHKLQFAFLMCVRILMDLGEIDGHEWHHFLAGGNTQLQEPNPSADWLSSKAWNEILSMYVLPNFKRFVESFRKYKDHYKEIFESQDPHRRSLPEELESFTNFQKLLILKCLRADKVTNAMQDFISDKMGQRFIEPQTTDLGVVFKDSGPTTPLIFVLSTGTDPAADLYKFADKMKFGKRMFSISLGQGQGPIAETMLHNGTEIGSWVFFQNCHLAPSWMPRLERLVENISPELVHKDFRIWLTSTPSPHFPVSILQNGSKMTIEPPAGIKANIMRAYTNQISDLVEILNEDGPKNVVFKLLLFSLCLFHGVLLERRKFGPLGFNIPYEFTDGDLKICISQLRMFLWEYVEIPFKVLTYTAGHINYGGRVTDDWDRRCLMNILADYYKPEVVDPDYVFDVRGLYHQNPPSTTYINYLDYIKTFPINDDPDLFGMHPNADITYAQSQTYNCLSTLLALQPRQVGGAAASEEEIIARTASSILQQLPKIFDLDEISKKYPVLYEESLNTVLIQEAIRYNRLLKIIGSTLQDLLKAIKGLVVMSEALDKMSVSLHSNLVPIVWASKAYPSLKPLGAWVADLNARVKFLVTWIDKGIPPVFWISGFYFPQAFLTATLQNFARKYVVSIDTINFTFQVMASTPTERPLNGCCIWGLFLEGSRWNPEIKLLDESNPKELYTDMPVIWLLPEENHVKPPGIYTCPVYKTLTRAGVLSTTGHSTNYVLAIEIPSEKPESHWIKRGVALICALDY